MRRRRAKFQIVARTDRAVPWLVTVVIDRETGLVTVRRAGSRSVYRMTLPWMLECAMARLMREAAQHLVAARKAG